MVSAYSPHGPITITSDADFASQGWPGSGTEADPYVIEGLNITTSGGCISVSNTTAHFVIRNCLLTGGSSGDGVTLDNVTNGMIEKCVISGNWNGVRLYSSSYNSVLNNTISDNSYHAVHLDSSVNNSVLNNTISHNSRAVHLYSSSNNTVMNNIISYSSYRAVYLDSSNGNSLVNNTVSRNGDDGVHLHSSNNNRLSNNTISHNGGGVGLSYSSSNNILVNNVISGGVELQSSSNNSLVDNVILDSTYGVFIWYSQNNSIVNNEFVNTGLYVDGTTVTHWLQTVTSDNTVNGKPLGYFSGLTGGVIDGSQYGQVILANCTGVTVRDGVFFNTTVGIELGFSSDNTLTNNTISHNPYGVYLSDSSNNSVVNSSISDCDAGVFLFSSSRNTVMNSAISDNSWFGVLLFSSSSNNSVANNTISDNYYDGVCLDSSPNNSLVNNEFVNNGLEIRGETLSDWLQTAISDNTVNGKTLGYFSGLARGVIDGGQYGQVILVNCTGVTVLDGVFINSSLGIELGFSSNNAVVNNTISDNSRYGVFLRSSSNNIVVSSNISRNGDGVWLYNSSNNILTSNTISDNSEYGVYLYSSSNNRIYLNILAWNGNNAYDAGSDNYWNTTGIGNYWSDYNGTGVYVVGPSTGSVDYHPRTWIDTTPPTINHPSDIEYVEGAAGHSITWSPYDDYPASYEVYQNGTLIESHGWPGGSITIDTDGLSIGTYNYTIVVYDKSGNWAKDTVFVTVIEAPDSDPPTIDRPADIEYVEGSTGHSITWNPSDAHAARYEIYRNGSLVFAGTWTGDPVTVGVDGLSAGTYNYTIVVYDESGNWTSDTVFVTVLAVTGTTTGTNTSTSTTSESTTSTAAAEWLGGPAAILVIVGAVATGVLIVLVVTGKRRG